MLAGKVMVKHFFQKTRVEGKHCITWLNL